MTAIRNEPRGLLESADRPYPAFTHGASEMAKFRGCEKEAAELSKSNDELAPSEVDEEMARMTGWDI